MLVWEVLSNCQQPQVLSNPEQDHFYFFPTCQVRVVRFYVSCLLRPPPPASSCLPPAACLLLVLSSSSSSNCDLRSTAFPAGPQSRPSLPVFPAGPQPRPSTPSVPCRASSTTICRTPPAGPQPRPSPPSVPCRTSTASIPAQCSLPDLNHDHPRPVFPAGPQPRVSTPKDMPHRMPEDMPIEC